MAVRSLQVLAVLLVAVCIAVPGAWFAPDLLRLMGYRIGAYALGYIDDVRDPLEAIRGATGSMSFGNLA